MHLKSEGIAKYYVYSRFFYKIAKKSLAYRRRDLLISLFA